MSKPNLESFISSNNLNISSSSSENPNYIEDAPSSSLNNLIINQQLPLDSTFSPNKNINSILTNQKLFSPFQSQNQKELNAFSSQSNLASTTPTQKKNSSSSFSSVNNQSSIRQQFKNKIIEPYLHREQDVQFEEPNKEEEKRKNDLSDLDCPLNYDKAMEESGHFNNYPADSISQSNGDIDNIKSTFDDLIKRKSAKEMILKKQIEINKKSLLDKFFSNNINTSSSIQISENDTKANTVNTVGEQKKENKVLPTIYEFNNTENSKIEYDETRALSSQNDNNMNNYMAIREKYKNERNKKKSSIFKSEDLRVSKTDTLNLKQSDVIDGKEQDNIYSPINDNNNIDVNQNNIVILQRKLFDSSNEVNDYGTNSSHTSGINSNRQISTTNENELLDDQSAFDINNISIKEDVIFTIEKASDFSIFGKKKQHKVIKHIDRSSRILSMEIVAKLDYDLSNTHNNKENNITKQVKPTPMTKKHNKTVSNIVMMNNRNTKNTIINQRTHSKNKSNNILNFIDKAIISPKPKIKEMFNSHKNSFIDGNKGTTYRNNSLKKKTGLMGNMIINSGLFPSTTKNKPISIKFMRTSSAKKYLNGNMNLNKNATLNTLSHNSKIKYSKLAYQVEVISKIKKNNFNDKLLLIFAEKQKENLYFKGLFEYNNSQRKDIANKIFSIGVLPNTLSLDHMDIFIENNGFIYEPISKIPNLCDKTILILKKPKSFV